eukprot:gene582-568_t
MTNSRHEEKVEDGLMTVDDRLHTVDLRNASLKQIPSETFSSFRDIRKLDLRRNLLDVIPREILRLDCLREILLDYNRIANVPAFLFEIDGLERIGLSNNLISKLPPIGPCPNLKILNVADNFLDESPEFIPGACKKLKALHMHNNSFSRIHSSFGHLDNLEELSLEWFRYTTPPSSRVLRKGNSLIGDLRKLCRQKMATTNGAHLYDVITDFSTKKFDVHGKDTEGRTRLHVACAEGHIGVSIGLVECRADCNKIDNHHFTPLLFAIANSNAPLVKKLLPHSEVERSPSHLSPVHFAATYPNAEIMKLLLEDERRIPINQKDIDANNPLHVIASVFDRQYPNAVGVGNLLVEHKVDLNGFNKGGYSPLQVAASSGQYLGVKWLTAKRKELMDAGAIDDCDRSNVDLEYGDQITIDIDARGGWGHRPKLCRTALTMAVVQTRSRVVQCLLESGANPFIKDGEGMYARHYAKGGSVIAKLLRKHEDLFIHYRVHLELNNFSMNNNEQPLKPKSARSSPQPGFDTDESLLLDSPHRPPRLPHHSNTPSPVRPTNPNENDLSPGRISESDERHHYPESHSPDRGQMAGVSSESEEEEEFVKPLPLKEVIKEVRRRTRGWQYNAFDMPQIFDYLLKDGVPVQQMPDEIFHSTVLPVFRDGPSHRIMFILTKKFDFAKFLTVRDKHGLSCVMYLCINKSEDCLRFLCSKLSTEAKRILNELVSPGQQSLVHLVLAGKKGVITKTREGQNGNLFVSNSSEKNNNIDDGHESLAADCLEILFSTAWFSLDDLDATGFSPLHIAAQKGDAASAQVLLEHGADPNCQANMTLYTPLHLAVKNHSIAVLIQLLHFDRTNSMISDRMDWPPLFEACHVCDTQAASLLVNAGSKLDFVNGHSVSVYSAVESSKSGDQAMKCKMAAFLAGNGASIPSYDMMQANADYDEMKRGEIRSQQAAYLSRPQLQGHDEKPPCFLPGPLASRCQVCQTAFGSCGTVICNKCALVEDVDIVCLHERTNINISQVNSPGSSGAFPAALEKAGELLSGRWLASEEEAREYFSPGGSRSRSQPPANDAAIPLSSTCTRRLSKMPVVFRSLEEQEAQGQFVTKKKKLCKDCLQFFLYGVGETYGQQEWRERQAGTKNFFGSQRLGEITL